MQAKLERLQSLLSASESKEQQNEGERSGMSVLTDVDKLLDECLSKSQIHEPLKQEQIPMDPDDMESRSSNSDQTSCSPSITMGSEKDISDPTTPLDLNDKPSDNPILREHSVTSIASSDQLTINTKRIIQNDVLIRSETSVSASIRAENIVTVDLLSKSEDNKTNIPIKECIILHSTPKPMKKKVPTAGTGEPIIIKDEIDLTGPTAILPTDSCGSKAIPPTASCTDHIKLDDSGGFNDLLGEFDNAEDFYGMFDDLVESELSTGSMGTGRTVAEVAEEVNITDHFDPKILGELFT